MITKDDKIATCTFLLPPLPTWQTSDEAFAWIEKELPRYFRVLEDLLKVGVSDLALLALDLGEITDAAAAFAKKPRRVSHDDQRMDPSASAQLARMLSELESKFDETEGATSDSLVLLRDWLASATEAYGTELAARLEQERKEARMLKRRFDAMEEAAQ